MLTQQEIQKYRAIANKLTVFHITKLNTQMLTELAVQLYLMADQLVGFNPSFAVINKLRERIGIVKPYDHKPYDVLIKNASDLLVKNQHEFTQKVLRFRFLNERIDEAMAKGWRVVVTSSEGLSSGRIIKVEKQDNLPTTMFILSDFQKEYDLREKDIDNETLIFKQDAYREALFSIGANQIWTLVDHLENQAWKSATLVNEEKDQLTISSDEYKFGSGFTSKPGEIPMLHFHKTEG